MVEFILKAPELDGNQRSLILLLADMTRDDFTLAHVVGEQQYPIIAEKYAKLFGVVLSQHQIKNMLVKCRSVFRYVLEQDPEKREILAQKAAGNDNWNSILRWYISEEKKAKQKDETEKTEVTTPEEQKSEVCVILTLGQLALIDKELLERNNQIASLKEALSELLSVQDVIEQFPQLKSFLL